MTDWVLAAERAYVAAAVGSAPRPAATPAIDAAPSTATAQPVPAAALATATPPHPATLSHPATPPAAPLPPHPATPPGLATPLAGATWSDSEVRGHARAVAAAGAIASRYLAVGTPRSFGILIDAASQVDAAQLSLIAHRTWFAPRDIRCAAVHTGAAELATATGGRVVSIEEALACDIVNVYAVDTRITPASLRRGTHVNTVSARVLDPELPALATIVHEAGLPALAAGLVDGRQLDEITIFVIDDAPIAASC